MVEIKVCSLIAEIAVGLRRLQSPTRCWLTNCICKLRNFCSLIVEIAVGLRRLQSPTRRWMTNCICKLPNLCNLSNQTAISAIRLQSQQSDCNLILKSVDCIWITQRERFNPWEMFWKYWHMAFIRLLGLLGFDCFRITWRMHQIALDHWDCT